MGEARGSRQCTLPAGCARWLFSRYLSAEVVCSVELPQPVSSEHCSSPTGKGLIGCARRQSSY
eukprot:COSAG01_NODE_616_length_14815_cov_8.518076_20_plen_63_part_00